MPKEGGGLGWVIPVVGMAALLFGLLVTGLALRLELSVPFPMPPVGCIEGKVESPDAIKNPAGPLFATGAVELSAYARPEGKDAKRTMKLWARKPNPVVITTADGPVTIAPPTVLTDWIDVRREELSFPTLEGVPMVGATQKWRKFAEDGNFTVYYKSLKHGDDVVMERRTDGVASRLWIGTRTEIAESQEFKRADPPWVYGISLTLAAIMILLYSFREQIAGSLSSKKSRKSA
jgi:hypothetical protein